MYSTTSMMFDSKESKEIVTTATESVPKIIHVIWFGHKSLPDAAMENILDWMWRNPDFDVYFWVDSKWTTPSIINAYPDDFKRQAKDFKPRNVKDKQASTTLTRDAGSFSSIESSSSSSSFSSLSSSSSSNGSSSSSSSNSSSEMGSTSNVNSVGRSSYATLSNLFISTNETRGISNDVPTPIPCSSSSSHSRDAIDSRSSFSKLKLVISPSKLNTEEISFSDPNPETTEILSEALSPFAERVQRQLNIMDINSHACFTQLGFDGKELANLQENPSAYSVLSLIHYKLAQPRSNPASASDIARIVVLKEFGGIYFDCGDVFPGQDCLNHALYFREGRQNHVFRFRYDANKDSVCNDFIVCSKRNPITDKILEAFFLQSVCGPLSESLSPSLAYLFLNCYDPQLNQKGTVASTGPKVFLEVCNTKPIDISVDPDLFHLPEKQALSWLKFLFPYPLVSKSTEGRLAESLERAVWAMVDEIRRGYFRPNTYLHCMIKSTGYKGADEKSCQKNIEIALMQKLIQTLQDQKMDFKSVNIVHLFCDFSVSDGPSVLEFCKKNLYHAYRLVFPSAEDLTNISEREQWVIKALLKDVSIPYTSIFNCLYADTSAAYYNEARENGIWLIEMGLGYLDLLCRHCQKELTLIQSPQSTLKAIKGMHDYLEIALDAATSFETVIYNYLLSKVSKLEELQKEILKLQKSQQSQQQGSVQLLERDMKQPVKDMRQLRNEAKQLEKDIQPLENPYHACISLTRHLRSMRERSKQMASQKSREIEYNTNGCLRCISS